MPIIQAGASSNIGRWKIPPSESEPQLSSISVGSRSLTNETRTPVETPSKTIELKTQGPTSYKFRRGVRIE